MYDHRTGSEAGLSDSCPDMAKAVNTWQFAIRNLKKAGGRMLELLELECCRVPGLSALKAAGSKLDAGTLQYVSQIEAGLVHSRRPEAKVLVCRPTLLPLQHR